MPGDTGKGGGVSRWRIAVWSTAAFLLLLPLVAMQFTNEVNWDETDFIVVGVMLTIACGICELAMRTTDSKAYRAAIGVAVAAALILVWMNLAVGIIGSEDNPANLMYGGVLAVGIAGAIIARFRANGMAQALVTTALAQALVAAIALITGEHHSPVSSACEILGLNGFFVALFLVSAWLFRRAAREQTPMENAD